MMYWMRLVSTRKSSSASDDDQEFIKLIQDHFAMTLEAKDVGIPGCPAFPYLKGIRNRAARTQLSEYEKLIKVVC